MKLKNELTSLVDTNIWVNALQEIKNREKNEKSRMTEISVENRIREEEIGRSKDALAAETANLQRLESELADAKSKGEH